MWNVKCENACSKHNVTAEFASNSTAKIKLSKRPSFFFFRDFEQVHYEK